MKTVLLEFIGSIISICLVIFMQIIVENIQIKREEKEKVFEILKRNY